MGRFQLSFRLAELRDLWLSNIVQFILACRHHHILDDEL